jgi:uncharacterized protein YoxC
MSKKTQDLLDKLEKGIRETMNSERYKEYLKFCSKFHNYSYNNSLLIKSQNPHASMVAGYKQWKNKFDRQVMKGEKSIKILVPSKKKWTNKEIKKDPKTGEVIKDPKTGKPVEIKTTKVSTRFFPASVFDISQTEGKPVPSFCEELKGSSSTSKSLIKAIEDMTDYKVSYENIQGNAKGYCDSTNKVIGIQEGMDSYQTAKTLVHELAHSKIHGTKDSKFKFDRATKEVQAESVAFIVSEKFGIDTSSYTFDYLASWSSTKELKELKESLNIINKASKDIIDKTLPVVEREEIHQSIINEYSEEFPNIKHISKDVSQKIANLNNSSKDTSKLSVNEIRNKYKEIGQKLDNEFSDDLSNEFNELDDIVKELNRVSTKKPDLEKNMKTQESVKVKSAEIEIGG